MQKNAQSLDQRILRILDQTDRMTLSTSVDGNSSAATVFFARDGFDLIFFTLNSTRKAEQIRVNPHVQIAIEPQDGTSGQGLQISGLARQITDHNQAQQAHDLLLKRNKAFQKLMDDPFLIKNKVVGYYRVTPLRIKYIDLNAPVPFEFREFPEHRENVFSEAWQSITARLKIWTRAVRAPFFTATIVPILLGAIIAWGNLFHAGLENSWNWGIFWLILIGGIFAHAGTNLANDYFDHTSMNDEINQFFTPFNGGSRIIQAGLIRPWKVLWAAVFSFTVTIAIGLYLNKYVTGAYFGSSLLLWMGFIGVALGAFYTWNPFRLGYRGLGEFSIALGFGPIMVLGTHFVLTQPLIHNNLSLWQWQKPLLASIPVAILIMLVVWINQFQDLPADAKVGKKTWVVRLAGLHDNQVLYDKPFVVYIVFNIISFGFIFVLALVGFFKPEYSTPFVLIALLPSFMVFKAVKWGKEWLEQWNKPDADRKQLPYELLKVNVSTIGVHLFTGLLLVLAYWLGKS